MGKNNPGLLYLELPIALIKTIISSSSRLFPISYVCNNYKCIS